MRSVTIIGVGRVGGALAIALARRGFRIEALLHRSSPTAKRVAELITPRPLLLESECVIESTSEIIFITTPDPEIAYVSKALSEKLVNRPVVFHTSGSLSSEALAPLREKGSSVASIHPLVSISDAVRGSEQFAESYFCVEGDDDAVDLARSIVSVIGGTSFTIPANDKPLYHAAAVTACGHLVALIDIAAEMLSECGLDHETAQKVLMPLVSSTVENLKIQDREKALTGTFARTDVDTLERHLKAFHGRVTESVVQIYLALGERSLDLVRRRGADLKAIDAMRERISIAKRNSG